MASNSILCVFNKDFDISFNSNPITSGEFWLTSDERELRCVETVSNIDNPFSFSKAIQEYTSCYECVTNNNSIMSFSPCFCSNLDCGDIFVDVSAFTEGQYLELIQGFSGNTKLTLYLEYINNGTLQKGCFNTSRFNTLSLEQYEQISTQLQANGQQIINDISYTAQTTCQECLTATSFVYQVIRCGESETIDYVYLPYQLNDYFLISYTDGINEYCGNVVGIYDGPPVPTLTFVTDYGKVECDVCQQLENKKVLIQNCIDDTEQYVVWASQLLGIGDASNFESFGGCYTIIGETTLDINAPSFLDFEPHNDCNSCLTCNGVTYDYGTCDEPSVPIGSFNTYEILAPGFTFFHPILIDNFVVIGPTSDFPQYFFPSVLPSSCGGPIFSSQIWRARECNSGFQIPVFTDGLKQVGDVVKILYGDIDFLCLTLEEVIPPDFTIGAFNTKRDGSGLTITFNDCTDCINNTTFGVRAVNCDTQQLDIVDLSYTAYTEFFFSSISQTTNQLNNIYNLQFNSFGFNCFLDSNGFCRTIVENCPQQPTGNLVIPVENYFSCPTCRAFNPIPEPPRVEGNEVKLCLEICTESGTTVSSVSPPHPEWTDGFGTQVTQLDMITLGGMNGLNN